MAPESISSPPPPVPAQASRLPLNCGSSQVVLGGPPLLLLSPPPLCIPPGAKEIFFKGNWVASPYLALSDGLVKTKFLTMTKLLTMTTQALQDWPRPPLQTLLATPPPLACLQHTVLVSYGCYNKLPQTRWLNTTQISSRTVLEARSPKGAGTEGAACLHSPAEVPGGECVLTLSSFQGCIPWSTGPPPPPSKPAVQHLTLVVTSPSSPVSNLPWPLS